MLNRAFYELVRSAPKGRWNGIQRHYGPEDVYRLRSGVQIEYTLATIGANKLWKLLETEPYVHALGAITGNQAMQMVRAGLRAIYLSGWQVAADGNTAGSMYPDQSLYPSNSGPELARRINKTLERASQIENSEGGTKRDWFVPIVADAEAGFGGPLNCFEIMNAYIEAGAAAVHFEDQLAAEKKCGHLSGKVLIPNSAHLRNLNAGRLAADVCGVPTVIVSRTDAESAMLLTSDVDEGDREFIDTAAGRTPEGFFRLKKGTGVKHCIKRSLATAPFSDLLWWETSTPNLENAKIFAEAIQKEFPGKMMAYNCSPSFNWRANLSPEAIAKFQNELGAMGYKFQFITLAGFHSLSFGMFELARKYKDRGMAAYSELQQAEFEAEKHGYTAVRHQREVGTGYFDLVTMAAAREKPSTIALTKSTEAKQFQENTQSVPGDSPSVRSQATINQPYARRIQHLNLFYRNFSGTPKDLQDRRVEITGPCDRKMVINALNSGAKTYMADFEDSTTPTWRNLIEGQKNLFDAIRGEISYQDPQTRKQYELNSKPAVLMVRPRGWHLPELHVKVDSEPMSGSIFDFAVYVFNNA
ncbi:unnamed protein product [Rotaria sordida]|uniref:Isocitrate lyase n=1 Tax=Rotaria sordida TaxID=392033 RepID=A0A814FRZ6_9BILA|nr:unnamed protein product [Rotaria sordida]